MDPREISRNVESFLSLYPNATLTSTAEKLGLASQEVEQALREVDGTSFQEFRQNAKLNEAFRQLGESRVLPEGPWEETRYHSRRIIPRTTVRYKVRSFWTRHPSFSDPCPMVDLSRGGLALLSEIALTSGKRVSLSLKLPEKSEEFQMEGRIVYAVATGVADFRYRIGVQFVTLMDARHTDAR
jgi:hypothetical protein